MERINPDFYKALFDDLDPEHTVKRFLELLLKLQNVERGWIWIKRGDEYHCIESRGGRQKLKVSRMQLSVPNRKALCDGSWKIQSR